MMLGSASAALAGASDGNQYQQRKPAAKMQFLDPNERQRRNARDKATVKYNFEDFLRQS